VRLQSVVRSALILALGFGVAAALYAALINVPESNVLMLVLSAVLSVGILATIGLTIGVAASVVHSHGLGIGARRAAAALPRFVAGLAVFALLWWVASMAANWWTAHRGETDALLLLHFNITKTKWLHETVAWLLWLIPWGLGGSAVATLTSSDGHGRHAWRYGLRASVRFLPLAAASMATLVISQGLRRLVFWLPDSLPPNRIEFVFAAVKLTFVYAVAITMAACVVAISARASEQRSLPDGTPGLS